jgi:hypothetical protein
MILAQIAGYWRQIRHFFFQYLVRGYAAVFDRQAEVLCTS